MSVESPLPDRPVDPQVLAREHAFFARLSEDAQEGPAPPPPLPRPRPRSPR